MVDCPICGKSVREVNINAHIDSGCSNFLETLESPAAAAAAAAPPPKNAKPSKAGGSFPNIFQFQKPVAQRSPGSTASKPAETSTQSTSTERSTASTASTSASTQDLPIHDEPPQDAQRVKEPKLVANGTKRTIDEVEVASNDEPTREPPPQRPKVNSVDSAVPLAERMRPKTLDEVQGQELVGPNGVLRGLIEQNRVPSMILWGGPGTGKTTIARLIAKTAGTRFVEVNSANSGVGECKKLFTEARNELVLTGRKTIVFMDELQRFNKAQQDIFLGPVEAGTVTLIGATTENPSFKVIDALLSRCRTFTLAKLTEDDIFTILRRALDSITTTPSALLDDSFLKYLSAFSDGDARTALNLLSIAMDLSTRPDMTQDVLKQSLTKTLVYDRAGDQHYDNISAFHKSVRGSDADAALYYLARMLQSGEDPLYIARRMIVIASEDIGLADNSMLSLATAAYTAAEKVGMPECRINLGHCAVALALSKKSTRSYRALASAYKALQEPGVAGLAVPIHLKNAPTRLMREMGYGKEYKYNPDYKDGKVRQDYLPEKLLDRRFLSDNDLGNIEDPELAGV